VAALPPASSQSERRQGRRRGAGAGQRRCARRSSATAGCFMETSPGRWRAGARWSTCCIRPR
jgi:hypothetical protein